MARRALTGARADFILAAVGRHWAVVEDGQTPEVSIVDIFEAIAIRSSIRSYRPDPIEEDKLQRILEATRLAPSAINDQPYKFIVVRDARLRQELARACHGQMLVAEAPLAVVVCGFRPRARIGGYTDSMLVDGAIALTHLILCAAAEGLGTCWLGAFDNEDVKAVLGIPAEVQVVAVTPLGYPTEPLERLSKRRKSLKELVCEDKFA